MVFDVVFFYFSFLLFCFFVPCLFEEKWRDKVLGFPSFHMYVLLYVHPTDNGVMYSYECVNTGVVITPFVT